MRGLVALAQEKVKALFGLSERGGVFGRLAKRGQHGIELQVVVARKIRCRSRTVRSTPSVTERTRTSTGGKSSV